MAAGSKSKNLSLWPFKELSHLAVLTELLSCIKVPSSLLEQDALRHFLVVENNQPLSSLDSRSGSAFTHDNRVSASGSVDVPALNMSVPSREGLNAIWTSSATAASICGAAAHS